MTESTTSPRPNLFVAGAPKCGTTSLYEVLRQHPNVFMSPVKEPRYWSSDLRAQGRAYHRRHLWRHLTSLRGLWTLPGCWRRRGGVVPRNWLGIERLDEYLDLFRDVDPDRHLYAGEASPDSLWSKVAADRIAGFQPDARVVIALREPLAYLASIHRETSSGQIGDTEPSLRRALELEPRRRRGREIPCTVRYPFTVFYRLQAEFDVQVQRFLRAFGRRQVHFVLLEDLADEPAATVDGLFAFLGISQLGERLDLRPQNVSKRGDAGRFGDLDADDVRDLRRQMRPTVERLEELTGRSLLHRWGYEILREGG